MACQPLPPLLQTIWFSTCVLHFGENAERRTRIEQELLQTLATRCRLSRYLKGKKPPVFSHCNFFRSADFLVDFFAVSDAIVLSCGCMHRRVFIKKTWLSAFSYAQSRISLVFCCFLGFLVPWFSPSQLNKIWRIFCVMYREEGG